MGQLQISVAMCTYNGARHLREQLDSICRQTLLPNEIVICDDNSTDETGQILREFVSRSTFTARIFSNLARMGSTSNFDQAIRLCHGDVIVLADQDDIWKNDRLEKLESLFEADREIGYAFSNGEVIDERGHQIGSSIWESLGFSSASLPDRFSANQVSFLLKQNVVTGAAMAFRSSLNRVVCPIPPGWLHDHWIALLGSIFARGQAISELLIMYRQHNKQQKGVRKNTISERYRESVAARNQDYLTKIERLRELESRVYKAQLSEHYDTGESLRAIREKITHLTVRSTARSATGLEKARTVMSELLAGRYHRFSDSWISVMRDLIA
jgi:glycosyltransferase involved in cell wall biosynthesis